MGARFLDPGSQLRFARDDTTYYLCNTLRPILESINMLKTSDRYLLKQLIFPFLLALIGFVIFGLLLLIGQLSELFVSRSIQPQALFLLMLYQVPYFLVWAFPIAYLFAILMAMGRMGHDSELVALQSAGLSPRRFLLPLVVMGLLLSAADFVISDTIAVRANKAFISLYTEQYLGTGALAPRFQSNTVFRGAQGYFFFIGSQDRETRELNNILIFNDALDVPDELATPQPSVWTAETGEWIDTDIKLYDAEIIAFGKSGQYRSSFSELFVSPGWTMEQLGSRYATPRQMSLAELQEQIEVYEGSALPAHSLRVEYNLKLAIPLGCLVFALLGGPLSLMIGPRGRSFALIATVTLVLLYQGLLFLSAYLLGNRGELSPAVAAWLPNLVFAGVGILLFVYAGALTRNDWIERLFPRLR